MRTLAQKEANEIDMEMFRLAGRLEEFAKHFPHGRKRDCKAERPHGCGSGPYHPGI